MNAPKKNLAESVLARAELYRRNMLFDGVPAFSADLQLPAAPAADAGIAPPDGGQGAPAPAPGATDELVAGAVEGATPLQTLVTP